MKVFKHLYFFRYQNISKWKFEVRSLLSLFTVGGLFSNIVLSNILLYISTLNYPGGVAFARLHSHVASSSLPVNIHICNLAAQTGVSRFGELRNNWRLVENILMHLIKLSVLSDDGSFDIWLGGESWGNNWWAGGVYPNHWPTLLVC